MKTLDPREDENSIGRLLLDSGVISPWQLSEALVLAFARNMMLGEALVGLGFVSESDVAISLELQKARRAKTNRERSSRTLDMMASASEQVATTLASSIANVSDKADKVVRQFARRRTTSHG